MSDIERCAQVADGAQHLPNASDEFAAAWSMLVEACEKINAAASITPVDRAKLCGALDRFSARLMEEPFVVQPECVITGCAVIVDGCAWAPADLFDAGDYWLLNIGLSPIVAWSLIHEDPVTHSKTVSLNPGVNWWERRGVMVVHKQSVTLNQAAIDYIA